MTGELPSTIETDSKGNPALPPEPFPDHGSAKDYAFQMVKADRKRSEWRAEVDDVLNGNAPIPQADLRAKKMGWFPNCNYREFEGYVNAPQTAFYDLVTEADPCIEIYLDYGNGQEKVDWEEAIAKHWTWLMLRRWRLGLNYHVPMCQREMLVHGLGCHVWTQMHANNWIERTPRNGHILFPEEAPVNFEDEGEAFMLRDYVPLHTLYGWIKNESAAQRLGWLPANVWKAMAQTSKAYRQNDRGDNVEAYRRQQKRGDIGGSITRQAGVWINWIYAREIETGEVSLYAVAENVEVGDYLFKKRFLYETWPLAMFPYDIGNGTIHTIRGLGTRAKDFFQLSNRIKNMMAAQVILGSTIPLQATGNVDPAKLKLLKLGMMSIIPQNLQIAQGFRFPDLSQGPLALDRELKSTLVENTQSYVSGTPEPRDRETATSFQMRAQDSAQVNKGTHGLYGSHLCNYYEKKLRMVLKAAKMPGNKPYITMAKEFVERCRKSGVPDEALDHICEVREVTSTGAGSAAARIQSYIGLMQSPVYLNTSEDRKINIERDYTAALFAGAKTDRYARSLNDNDMPDSDDSIIALENDALARGGKAVVAPHQNQVHHAQGHLEGASEVIQGVQQDAMPPDQALAAIRAFGQHIAAHLEAIKQNPTKKADYEALRQQLGQLASAADQLQQHLEQSQGAQAPQQQISDDLQIGLAKVQSNHQIKSEKLQSDTALRFRKATFDERLKDATAAAKIRRDNLALPQR